MACRITSSAAAFDGRSGAKPPSSPTAVREPAVVQHLLQRVEDLGAVAQRLAQSRRADRQDHEFLDVEAVVGMRAAVDDVHHRHRHRRPCRRGPGASTATASSAFGGRMRGGQRHRQQRVGAEPALGVGAVELDHRRVEPALILRVVAEQRVAQHRIDVADGLQHALAEVARLVAVAQLDRLARAGRGAGGHRGAPERRRRRGRRRPRPWGCRASR